MRKNGWQFFLVLFAPAILLMFGIFWLLSFYLKDIEELEKIRGKQ